MFRFTAEEGGPVYLDLSIVDMENEIDGNNQDVTENDSIVESCTSSDEDISGTGSSSICSVWLENETEPNLLYVRCIRLVRSAGITFQCEHFEECGTGV